MSYNSRPPNNYKGPSDDTYQHVPIAKRCEWCRKRSEDLKKCSRCRVVVYCSRACQKLHYKKHKKFCKATMKARQKEKEEGSYGMNCPSFMVPGISPEEKDRRCKKWMENTDYHFGQTQLHECAWNGWVEVAQVLLDTKEQSGFGKQIFMRNAAGETPLHSTCRGRNGDVRIAKMLIEHGADIDDQDPRQGITPLIAALKPPDVHMDIAKLLIECGADVTIKTFGKGTLKCTLKCYVKRTFEHR